MRLMIVGQLDGHMKEAGRLALLKGAKVAHATSLDQALGALRGGKGADLVMIDVGEDIARFISQLEAERIALPVIACGVASDAQAAVKAIQAGAREYVPLPPDAELIAAVLEAVAREDTDMIAKDPAMLQVVGFADKIAGSDASVLITGESGTGKEVMARYVHRKSRRADRPFISLNCAAIPENLLESELFGHEKGAFTGALARRIGKFEEANGGTLLLDEISEMDIKLQAKLLRAIQEREIDRLGGKEPVKVDIRVLATSNRDLESAVNDGSFREDLYFRLNVINLAMPALRDRPADIPLLAEHFAKKYADLNGLPARSLAPSALARLTAHGWRGNVRELENTLHRAVLIATGDQIEADAIVLTGEGPSAKVMTSPAPSLGGPAIHNPPAADDPTEAGQGLVGKTVADVERDLILETLHHCLGNRTHAANILGISIRTLRNKLKQYSEEGLPIPMPREGVAGAYAT